MQGLVGYKARCGCAIVFGAPLCAPDKQQQLLEVFTRFCVCQGLKVQLFFNTDQVCNLRSRHLL